MTWDPPTPGAQPAPAPGFYADPYDPAKLRFFDGVSWTHQTTPVPTPPRPPRRSPFPPSMVSGVAVVLGALVALAAATVTGIVGLLLVALTSGSESFETDSVLGVPPLLVFFGALGLWIGFATAFHIARSRNGLSVKEALGPIRPLLSALAALAGVAAQAAVVLVSLWLGVESDGAPLEAGPVGWVLLALALIVGAPIFEELFFRGVLLPTLAARMGTHPAVLVQAVLFGLVHFDQGLLGIAAISILAVGLGYLRVRSRSVVPAIALHATFNAAAFTLLALGA